MYRNSLGSSLPDATDAAPRQQQIARHPTKNDAHGNQINDPDLLRKRTIDNGRSEETDSDIDDDDLDSDIEELHDDEWSGEPDRIETAVLANVEDLEFAAWLIIQLHRDQAQRKAQKIGGWQKGVVSCQGSSGSGESQRQASISSSGDQRSSNPRKRKRTSESDDRFSDDGDGEERDDGEGNGSPVNQDDDLTSGNVTRKYACPFNKLDPNRFGSNTTPNNEFRVCESGSKNIQRLKYESTIMLGIRMVLTCLVGSTLRESIRSYNASAAVEYFPTGVRKRRTVLPNWRNTAESGNHVP